MAETKWNDSKGHDLSSRVWTLWGQQDTRDAGVGIDWWTKLGMTVGEHEGRDASLEKKSRMRAENKLRAGAGLVVSGA